jgi:polyisoprenoid-binding protein YceI
LKLAALALAAAVPVAAGGRNYAIDPAASRVEIRVGKSGVFSFAGHEHRVLAPAVTGQILADPADLAGSSVQLTFQSGALTVVAKGEPEGDAQKVETAMHSPSVLDVARFPEITFVSKAVSGAESPPGTWSITITGEIGLHGVARSLTLPIKVTTAGDELTAVGRVVLKQTDFHMSPVSVGGVVKVKDEVAIEYTLVARAAP